MMGWRMDAGSWEFKRSNRNLIFLSSMIFLLSIGEGLTAPAIPLFGLSLGARYWQLGLLMTGYGVAYTTMTMLAGRLSDYTGRKPMLVSSLVLSVIASLGYVLSRTINSLLVFRTMEGAGRGILWPVAEAAVADTVAAGDPGKAMGMFTAAYGFGVSLGALFNIFVTSSAGVRGGFAYYPVLGLVALILVVMGFKPAGRERRPVPAHSDRESDRKGWGVAVVRPLWPLGVVSFAYAGFLYSIWALFSALAHTEGISNAGIGFLFTLFWGIRTVTFFLAPVFRSQLGSKRGLIAGLLLCCGGAGALLMGGKLLLLAAILSGIGTGIVFPLCLVLVSERTEKEDRGLGMGFLELCMGCGTVIQTSMSGLIGQWLGVTWTYLSIFVANVLAIAVSGFLFRQGDEAAPTGQ